MDALKSEGRLWLRNALSASEIKALKKNTSTGQKPGVRLGVESLGASLRPANDAVCACRPGMKPVRLAAFDKNENSNWVLPWHQDRVIAVAEKMECAGYENWTNKSGVWHCEPPEDVLKRMLFVRVHLDDCDEENGAMQIALGSHREGVVTSDRASSVAGSHELETCDAAAGDILILDMFMLHRSLPSKSELPRATLRLDYADFDLPKPLAWSER